VLPNHRLWLRQLLNLSLNRNLQSLLLLLLWSP
jgi:hypothetical protein